MISEVLAKPTKELLDKFSLHDFPEGSYLGGGTAVALWLGHRQSEDLDWFSPKEFDEKMWQMKWENDWQFTLMSRDWQTLEGQIGEVKTSLYYYKYPMIGKSEKFGEVQIAGLEDLSAMKLEAIISRGTKRDFVDLYFLAKKFGLDKMFEYYDLKYGLFKDRELIMKKALIYFDEADTEEMPNMLTHLDWKEVKAYFTKVVI